MFACCSLCLGPHGFGVSNIFTKLLVIQDVQIRRRVDQIHQGLGQLPVFVEILKLGRNSRQLVDGRPWAALLRVLRLRDVVFRKTRRMRRLLFVDGHHLDEVAHGVLPIH